MRPYCQKDLNQVEVPTIELPTCRNLTKAALIARAHRKLRESARRRLSLYRYSSNRYIFSGFSSLALGFSVLMLTILPDNVTADYRAYELLANVSKQIDSLSASETFLVESRLGGPTIHVLERAQKAKDLRLIEASSSQRIRRQAPLTQITSKHGGFPQIVTTGNRNFPTQIIPVYFLEFTNTDGNLVRLGINNEYLPVSISVIAE